MKNKFLIVLAFVAILTTAFVSVCGAYHTDVGGTYFPVNGSRPGVELMSFVGANDSNVPSSRSASFSFSPYFISSINDSGYPSVYTEERVSGGEVNQTYELYTGVEPRQDGLQDVLVTEINHYTDEQQPLFPALHYGASVKTFAYRGNISEDMFSPEYMLAFMYSNNHIEADNISFRVRDVVTISCYVEDVSYTGSVTPTLESVTLTLDETYPFDPNSYYCEHYFSASDFIGISEVDDLFSRAMTIDGTKPYIFSGHNVSVTQIYNDTGAIVTDLTQASDIYTLRVDELSALSSEINQVTINTTLPELPQIRNVVSVSHFWDFITSSLNTLLSLNIAPGVTLGDVLGIGVSVSILLILLKVFAGG